MGDLWEATLVPELWASSVKQHSQTVMGTALGNALGRNYGRYLRGSVERTRGDSAGQEALGTLWELTLGELLQKVMGEHWETTLEQLWETALLDGSRGAQRTMQLSKLRDAGKTLETRSPHAIA